jgi:hypothetical protein
MARQADSEQDSTASQVKKVENFACFLTFAHLYFAAFTIAALPAADTTQQEQRDEYWQPEKQVARAMVIA